MQENSEKKLILSVQDLKVHYPVKIKDKGFFTQKKVVKAVDGISFDVFENETLGIVGESGCGKSTLGKAIVGLNKPTQGSICYQQKNLATLSKSEKTTVSKEIQMIFQDPYSSLDPRFTVGKSIREPFVVHNWGTKQEKYDKVVSLMQEVGLREEVYTRYPHEFSGGQRQRIGVARALALNPKLLVCDEPVSALDVSIQAQILNLMKELQDRFGLTYIFISHNLTVVRHLCDRIIVMYLGNVVEVASSEELFHNPLHPYTTALMSAVPMPDPTIVKTHEPLQGDVPSPVNPPVGCPFSTRCPKAMEICHSKKPVQKDMGGDHKVCCHLY